MSTEIRERQEVEAANTSGLKPVVFVHGLWLLSSSWDNWRSLFEKNGYATVSAGWPGDPDTVAEAHAHPETFSKKSIQQITDHHVDLIKALDQKPAIIGHSFGGLVAQRLAGLGLAATTVAVDAAPFRGVLPLPVSALKVASVVLSNPANRGRSVGLSYEQFRYGFANAVSEDEARQLYDTYSVAGSGVPLFQAAFANLNPGTEAKVDTKNPDRGPLLLLSGTEDHTVPWAITKAEYKLQKKNVSITEVRQIEGRGHSLTIDSGWQDVADISLEFIKTHH
jgi:pimeloyl-ACP methyl ester carboxylesterase